MSQALLDKLLGIGIPLPAMLDTEWTKLRGGQGEGIHLLDGLYIGGEWVGQKDLNARRESFWTKPLPEGIHRPAEVSKGFVQFLMDQIPEGEFVPAETLSEGIVMKKVDARLIGSRTKSEENGLWAKIKWRHGQGGDTQIVFKDDLEKLKHEVH